MARSARARSRVLPILALFLPLLAASTASAGWGNENRGEMVWGPGAPQIPAMAVGGIVAVAKLLLDTYGHYMPTERHGFADALSDSPGRPFCEAARFRLRARLAA